MSPRDGSGIYSTPPGTDAITNTTISSTAYNTNVNDVEADLNTPRPIVAGGTGETNAREAMIALSGEIAHQQILNYDSYLWVEGSFFSDPGATAAPDAVNVFTGICYKRSDNNIVLEARTVATGVKHVRRKVSGVWGAWVLDQEAALDLANSKVDKDGDTMTGALTISPAAGSAQLILDANVTTNSSLIGQKNGLSRWAVIAGDNSAEGTGNTGSNFTITPFTDAGAPQNVALTIERDNGRVSLTGGLNVEGLTNLTSPLVLNDPAPLISLNSSANGATNSISGSRSALTRWMLQLGDGIVESGSDSGSHFRLLAYNDAGTTNWTPISILRDSRIMTVACTTSNFINIGATGNATITGNVSGYNITATGTNGLRSQGANGVAAEGVVYFGTTSTKYLFYNGTDFILTGGSLTVEQLITGAGVNALQVGTADGVGAPVNVRGKGTLGIDLYNESATRARVRFCDSTETIVYGTIEANPNVFLFGGANTGVAAALAPLVDNGAHLGAISNRWTNVYATNGTIQTSDAAEKSGVDPIGPADPLLKAADTVPITTYTWTVEPEKRSGVAPIRIGTTSQAVEAAFAAAGLDANQYGLFVKEPRTRKVPVTETVERQATETVQVTQTKYRKQNGHAVAYTETVEQTRGKYDTLPVVDAAGNAVMVDGVQQTVRVPVMETVTVEGEKEEVVAGEYDYALNYSELLMLEVRALRARLAALEGKPA